MAGRIVTAWMKWAKALKRELIALHLAARDSRTPLVAKLAAAAVVAYALSPIDLVPDFIPVLGQLDDLILIPLGLWLVIRLTPPEALADARARARDADRLSPSRAAGVVIACLWIVSLTAIVWIVLRKT